MDQKDFPEEDQSLTLNKIKSVLSFGHMMNEKNTSLDEV